MQATRLAGGGGGGGGMNAQLPVHPPRRASSRGTRPRCKTRIQPVPSPLQTARLQLTYGWVVAMASVAGKVGY